MEHEAWLFVNKHGPTSRQWKKRWVGWNENGQSLEYRKQPGEAKSTTVIPIGKVDSISVSSVCHHRKNDTSHNSTGFIIAADRVYYFSADTTEDRDKWIEFLQRKRNVYISLGSSPRSSLTTSGHDYTTSSELSSAHLLASLPPLMPVLINEAMSPRIQITPRSEGDAPLSPHIISKNVHEEESKRASWSPMSSHEVDLLKKEKDQLEIDLKSLRDKFDTVSEKYRLETSRLSVNNGSQRIRSTSESAPNTLKFKSSVRKSILPGASDPYENDHNVRFADNNTNPVIDEVEETEQEFVDLDKLINDGTIPAREANSLPDTVIASPREQISPRQALSPDSTLNRRRMHKGHSKSDEFNRSAVTVVSAQSGPEELKNINFSKFGYYAKNKTSEEIVLDLLNENKTLKERKRKAENDLGLLQLKYNEDLRKLVEYDHIIEKLNDDKLKLREQTVKLKTDRAKLEQEKEAILNNNSNSPSNTIVSTPATIRSPRMSVDRTIKDIPKKLPKKQLVKDLEAVTKQLDQFQQEFETAKQQWQNEKKKLIEDERNKAKPDTTSHENSGSTSPKQIPGESSNMTPEQERVFYKKNFLKLKERHDQDLKRTKSLEEERNKLKTDLANRLTKSGSGNSGENLAAVVNTKLFNHPQLEQSQLLKEKLALNNELRQLRLQLSEFNNKINSGSLQPDDPQKLEIESAIQAKTTRFDEVSKLLAEEDVISNLNSSNLATKPKTNSKMSVPNEVRISIKTLTVVMIVIIAYVFKTL